MSAPLPCRRHSEIELSAQVRDLTVRYRGQQAACELVRRLKMESSMHEMIMTKRCVCFASLLAALLVGACSSVGGIVRQQYAEYQQLRHEEPTAAAQQEALRIDDDLSVNRGW